MEVKTRCLTNLFGYILILSVTTFGCGGGGGSDASTPNQSLSTGTTWTQYAAPTNDVINNVYYGNGKFYAFGSGNTSPNTNILFSGDGKAWSAIDSGASWYYYDGAYGNSVNVIVGLYGSMLTSSNGSIWSYSKYGNVSIQGVTYGNGKFVAVGMDGLVLTSNDGQGWAITNIGSANIMYDVSYGNGKYVAVGTKRKIFTSQDGLAWNTNNSGVDNVLYTVAFGNGMFVAGGAGSILTSPDGSAWTIRKSDADITCIVFGNEVFVAVGPGIIMTSPDGINWTSRVSNVPYHFSGIAYGNGVFVAVGNYFASPTQVIIYYSDK